MVFTMCPRQALRSVHYSARRANASEIGLFQESIQFQSRGVQQRLIYGSIPAENHLLEDVVEDLLHSAPVLIEGCGYAGDHAVVEHEDGFVDNLVNRLVTEVLDSFFHGRDEAAGALGEFNLDIGSGDVLQELDRQVIVWRAFHNGVATNASD